MPRKRRMSRTYTEDFSVWEAKYGNGRINNTPNVVTPSSMLLPGNTPITTWSHLHSSVTPPLLQSPTPPSLLNTQNLLPSKLPLNQFNNFIDQNLLLTEIVNPEENNSNHCLPTTPRQSTQHLYTTTTAKTPNTNDYINANRLNNNNNNNNINNNLFEKQDPLVETFLYHQMNELRETNQFQQMHHHQQQQQQQLNGKYNNGNGIIGMGEQDGTNNINNSNNNGNNNSNKVQWHTFSTQQEFGISVWKGTNTPGLNYLVECNSKFIDLVGYNLNQLKNNFPCQKLFVSKAFGQKDWPKRTQIATAFGFKDVYLTIYPLIGDLSTPNKYFIVNMLELPSLSRVDSINNNDHSIHHSLSKDMSNSISNSLSNSISLSNSLSNSSAASFKPDLLRHLV